MVLIPSCRWRLKNVFLRARKEISSKTSECFLVARSLTYNTHVCQNYIIDCLLEPIFRFVDNFSKYLGKVFVFCVIVLTTAVVIICYWVGLPYWIERDPYITVLLVLVGHWLLWNISFHYYMGIVTPPGYPPDGATIVEAAGICKKCISPKPPRTHHCSICDRCILAMDHHCPWLNNCVGFLNARYFYLYMLYMVVGVSFIIVAGLDIGYVVLWLNDTGGIEHTEDEVDLEGHPVQLNQSGVFVPVEVIFEYNSDIFPRHHNLPIPIINEAQRITGNPWKKKAVIFMASTCVTVLIALGTLTVMHGKQISRGETSVEAYINSSLSKKMGKVYRNPYDFGRKKNWRLFLGLTQGRSFFWHILIPSRHRPTGTGLTWHTVYNVLEDWP